MKRLLSPRYQDEGVCRAAGDAIWGSIRVRKDAEETGKMWARASTVQGKEQTGLGVASWDHFSVFCGRGAALVVRHLAQG